MTIPPTEETPQELNRLEILRGLKIATWEGSFATIWATLTTGAFLTGFALWLGASPVVIGFLTAIPTFAGLIQFVSSYFGEQLGERRRFTAWFSVAGRTLWLPILLLPLFLPHSVALYTFLFLFAISYVLLNVPAPAYMSWMSDLVPPDHRGRYFGRRNMIAGIVGMLIGLPAAWFLDVATRRHHWEALGFGVLFGVGVVGGLASFVCLLRQPEPPRRARNPHLSGGFRSLLAYYRTPFDDPNFRRLMVFNTIFGLGQNFAAPFFTVFALERLHLNYVWLQVFATLTGITTLFSMPVWGLLGDKFGNKPLLAIGVVGVFTLPLSWILTSPAHPLSTLLLLTEVNLAGGLFWAGVGLAQFNLLIRLSPSEKTPVYVATMAAVTGLMGGLAPLAGSAVMRALEGWTTHFLGLTWGAYRVTFLIAALLRLVSLLWLRPLVDADSASTRDVLQQLGRANPRTWRHMRQLQRGAGQEERLRATEALGESRTRLAVDELQTALFDPSQAVRLEAARALGEIAEPDSVDALLRALRDPAAGLTEEAANALGRIGDRRANPALIEVLNNEDGRHSRRDRLVAARALGELGGPDAVEALLAALPTCCEAETGDEEMAEAVIAALGSIGDHHVAGMLAQRLEVPNTSRSLRLALIRALGELGDGVATETLRSCLNTVGSDPILLPPLADALARLGDTEAAIPLLEPLSRLESPVARRQVAHAVGVLMGSGEQLYALLSQEAFARDEAVSRMIQEIQRRLRATSCGPILNTARDAYIAAEYAECVRALATVAKIASLSTSESAAHDVEQERHGQILSCLADPSLPPTLETTLLALVALRGFVETVA